MTVLDLGALKINAENRVAFVDTHLVRLGPREFDLLVHLARNPTQVVTKDELLRELWGGKVHTSRVLDTAACRLRRELARLGIRAPQNVWGVGYRLFEPVAA